MDLEEFIDIQGYEGLYKINKNGDVFSIKHNKILKRRFKQGYFRYSLSKNNKQKDFSIHRLLGVHFIPNPENLEIIDHIDRNKLNNNINNLRWVTRSDNCKNILIKGCIYKLIDKGNIRYRVTVRCKYKGQFKTYDEAQEFLKKYLEENEN